MMSMRVRTMPNGDETATVFADGIAILELEDSHRSSLGGRVIDALIAQAAYAGGEGDWSDYRFPNRILLD